MSGVRLGTKVNLTTAANDYWYVYGRVNQSLTPHLFWTAKIGHRYSRSSSDRHLTTIELELEALF